MRRCVCTLLIAVLVGVAGNAAAALPAPQVACTANLLRALLAPSVVDEMAVPDWMVQALPDQPTPVSAADPRRLLVDFAMTLRDIRYRRGGRSPQHGFDCSGFVHYVFAQVLGVDLPENSAGQFADSRKISRAELQAGDLVFFHTRGRRISHVGIYLGAGRFIHSPTTGERVRVDRLSEHYWARRFAGARRPDALI
ncbi:MAG: C40 family peptidase [Xanthomonadaceae bacterium]|nr:C40 family peptidase [Xanthomonadaceae bacterium]